MKAVGGSSARKAASSSASRSGMRCGANRLNGSPSSGAERSWLSRVGGSTVRHPFDLVTRRDGGDRGRHLHTEKRPRHDNPRLGRLFGLGDTGLEPVTSAFRGLSKRPANHPQLWRLAGAFPCRTWLALADLARLSPSWRVSYGVRTEVAACLSRAAPQSRRLPLTRGSTSSAVISSKSLCTRCKFQVPHRTYRGAAHPAADHPERRIVGALDFGI